jgi:hypothetical protein
LVKKLMERMNRGARVVNDDQPSRYEATLPSF